MNFSWSGCNLNSDVEISPSALKISTSEGNIFLNTSHQSFYGIYISEFCIHLFPHFSRSFELYTFICASVFHSLPKKKQKTTHDKQMH